jgi:hypothetical protein
MNDKEKFTTHKCDDGTIRRYSGMICSCRKKQVVEDIRLSNEEIEKANKDAADKRNSK